MKTSKNYFNVPPNVLKARLLYTIWLLNRFDLNELFKKEDIIELFGLYSEHRLE